MKLNLLRNYITPLLNIEICSSNFCHPKNPAMVLESLNKTKEPKEIKKTFQDGLLCKSSICPPAWVKMHQIQKRTKLLLIKLFKTRNFPIWPKMNLFIKKNLKVEIVILKLPDLPINYAFCQNGCFFAKYLQN